MKKRYRECFRYFQIPSYNALPFGRRNSVKASAEWLAASGAEFSAGLGHHGYAQLRNYSAEYREWGDGPPLVLVPGLAGGFELLGPVARVLAQHYRVISYQLRGENDCFALRSRFELQDLVTDLDEFLHWRCLESPVVCGVSFGGIIALEFAARFPHRLNALVVQGAGARFEGGLLQRPHPAQAGRGRQDQRTPVYTLGCRALYR